MDLLTTLGATTSPSTEVQGRGLIPISDVACQSWGLYDVTQAFTQKNPLGDTLPAEIAAFRGSYGNLGTWELPLTVRPETSTLIPVAAPLALPAMPCLASVAIYDAVRA